MAFDVLEEVGSENMAWSVTRHVLSPPAQQFEFLAAGIDTLDLGFYVEWNPDLFAQLVSKLNLRKERACGSEGISDQLPNGRPFLHLPSGKAPNYRFQLRFNDHRIFLGITNPPQSSPNAYASLDAKSLWHHGIAGATDLAQADLAQFGAAIQRVQPSRLDLCADFYVPGGLSRDFIEAHRATRSRKANTYMHGDRLETFYAGDRGAPVQIRIYDKGKEILKSRKEWFLPIWGRAGPEDVWRVEYQLRRPALKEYGIETLADLSSKLGGIWAYLTTDWFSLRLPDNAKVERRTVHPFWEAVQGLATRFGPQQALDRITKEEAVPTLDSSTTHLASCLPAYGARRGARNLDETLLCFQNDASLFWFDRNFEEQLNRKKLLIGREATQGEENDDAA